jgi:hypothetical protein
MNEFQGAASYLFRECFEGRPEGRDYTWFVEGREAILPTLDTLTGERASIKANAATASIAGHAYHILYTLRGANAQRGGPEPEGTWEDSWKKQDANPEEWDQLRLQIRNEYESFINWYETNEEWSADDMILGCLALLPHMAFHLGAIQQIVRVTA